jgi:signal transduction histidine kinase/ligand-binding sensor domain-containing protein
MDGGFCFGSNIQPEPRMKRTLLSLVWSLAISWIGGLGWAQGLAAQDLAAQAWERLEPGEAAVTVGSVAANARSWSISDGLPQSTITDMLVDDDGFLWGSTFGGLFRFDGQQFRVFQPERAIGDNSLALTAMARSARGGFWVVTAFGAASRVVDGVVVEALPVPEQLPAGEFPATIFEARDGRVWLVGWGRTHVWDGSAWELLPGTAQRAWPAHGIHEMATGEMILATPAGPVRLGSDEPLPRPFDLVPADTSWMAHSEDSEGRLWMGSRGDFFVYADGELLEVPLASGLLLGAFPRFDGSVWLVTFRGIWLARGPGLDRPGRLATETMEIRPLDPATNMSDGQIISAALTSDDVLMIGTLGRGLIAITPRSVFRVDVRPFLRDDRPDTLSIPVHSVVSDGEGGLWVSRDCGRVVRLRGGLLQSFRNPAQAMEVTQEVRGCVRGLFRSEDGRVLASIPNGFLRIEPNEARVDTILFPRVRSQELTSPFGEPAPRDYVELGPDTLLVGLSNGWLMLLEGDGTGAPPAARVYPGWRPDHGSFARLALAGDGTIWAGLVGGLRVLRPDGTLAEEIGAATEGRVAEIRGLLPEADGGLWVARYGGGLTYRSPSGTFRAVPLADPTISGMVMREDGSLWLAQNSGITILLPELVDAARNGHPLPPMVRRITLADGAFEVNNGRPAITALPSGILAVGTVEGLLLVDPSELPPPPGPRPVRIDAVRTSTGTANPGGGVVRLPLGERAVEVDLIVPAFRSTDPVRLRYRLISGGLRRQVGDWIELPYGESLRLGGLAPGRQRLHLEAALPGGGWAAASPLEIRVEPFFFERASVQFGLFMLIAGLLMLLVRARLREAEQERNLEIQRRVEEERERHLGELALMGRHAVAGELTASLAHEMGQPLTAMLQTATAVQREMEAGPLSQADLEETMDEFVAQIHRARNVLRGMRRFLRTETPQIEEVDLVVVIQESKDLLRRETERQRAEIALDLPDAPVWISAERVLIQQILIILLSNALEAMVEAPAGQTRSIRVRLRPTARGARITVQDRGHGIEASRLPRIFEPFETDKRAGMGMGLPIARRIVRSHRGGIGIRSRLGAGTVVSFWLPRITRPHDQPLV